MSNSERLHSLLSDGKLHLSVLDMVELALENNLDIAVARFNVAFAQTDVLRTQSGGAARGFTGSFQSSALYSGAIGSGVTAGGVGVSSGAGGVYGSASATQLGGGSFDPSAFFSFGWDRNTTPLGTTVVTGVPFEPIRARLTPAAYSRRSRQAPATKSCCTGSEHRTRRSRRSTTPRSQPSWDWALPSPY